MVTVSAASVQFEQKRDIEYAQVDGVSLRMDASIPKDAVRVPAAIIVHGGGWVRGDRRTEVEPLFDPLNDAGFAWFSIDYRLVNNVIQFGEGIEDVESAVRFIKSHAAEFHIDPDKLALIGESAGGQLAAIAALRLPPGSVKAVVALYTPTDLVTLLKNSNYIPAQIRKSVEGTPWENLILAGLGQLSPIQNVRRDMPPFLFIHGTADPLVPFSQSTAMCQRMRQAGASCEVYPLEGAGHGIRWWESSPRYEGYKRKMTDWLFLQLTKGSS
ncbi:MAG: alpha/beta hydrolase [Acidobacteriaceae bacterium]|nr:alpha/beta hydrolase [Acidobacteriaceae bacterium]